MKDISKFVYSKEYEHRFWKHVQYQFSIDSSCRRIYALFASGYEKDVFLVIENDELGIPRCDGDFEILPFAFKDGEHKIIIAPVDVETYNAFLAGDINTGRNNEISAKDGIEITREDLPPVYALLG